MVPRRAERAQNNLAGMLKEATSYYDGPGKQPPRSFEAEKSRIMYVPSILTYIM